MTSPEAVSGDPCAELFCLHEAGELAKAYPAVRGLLARLSGRELERAGRLLARLDPDDVLAAHPDTPATAVAVTGHGTLNSLVAPLTAELARHGLLLRCTVSDFDSYVFDLSKPDSDLRAANPDIVLCVLDPAVIFDEVPTPWRPNDVRDVLDAKLGLIERLVAGFTSTATATLVLNTIPLPRRFTAQLVDHRSRAALGALWREANARLLRLPESHRSVVVLDTDPLVGAGIASTDQRLSVYAKAHVAPGLLAAYAREVGHLARHLAGRTKKTLALDLDGTVWGGVLGDDGIDGIEVADTYRGAAFQGFQKVVKQLAAQGVLVTAVSKNDLDPVRQVLREHPRMTLREEDFVRIVANWRPKHQNLAELATGLNLGLDSFVFVDDNPYETGLVRRELPEVLVIDAEGDPAEHAGRLLADGWFDVVETTEDDRRRPARYAEELERKDFLHSFDSVQDYLDELDISVRLAEAQQSEIPRVSSLTLRTNQFNLTTQRLRPADVEALVAAPDAMVWTIHASDRFGDNGLVGAVLAHREGGVLRIDNFLLSCRVFARGIEQAALSTVLTHARATGVAEVAGTYRASPKNGKVREFYSRNGFEPVHDDGETLTFRHSLRAVDPPPTHVRLTTTLQGKAQ